MTPATLPGTVNKLKDVSSVDDVPGEILNYANHTGANGIHEFLDVQLGQLARPYQNPVAVRDALMRGYHNAGRLDLEELIKQWFNLHIQ